MCTMVAAAHPSQLNMRQALALWKETTRALELEEQQHILRARQDFNHYVEYVMRDETGVPMRQAVHHRVWQAHISYCWQRQLHPAIMAPWAHGKTTQCVVGQAPYLLGCNPNLRIKIVCNTDDKAKERLKAIADIITLNPYFKRVFPHVVPVGHERASKYERTKWTAHSLFVKRSGSSPEPSIQANGVLSSGIGGRADVLIFDDVVDQRNAIDNEALRDKVIQNFGRVWMSRLEPHGKVIYIGTPWHQADLSHQLYGRKAWCVLRQYVSSDYQRLNQEVYNMPPGYPVPEALGDVKGAVGVAR